MSENETIADRMARRHKEQTDAWKAKQRQLDEERGPTDPKQGWVVLERQLRVKHVIIVRCATRSEHDPKLDWFEDFDGKHHSRSAIHPTEHEALEKLLAMNRRVFKHHHDLAQKAADRCKQIEHRLSKTDPSGLAPTLKGANHGNQ